MEHNAPHDGSVFEGYYSKFDFGSGGHLALVVCRVKGVKTRPNVISFTYVPADATKAKPFQKEVWVDDLHMVKTSTTNHSFALECPGVGYIRCSADSSMEYLFEHQDFSFRASSTTRTPWSEHTSTPEALLVHLPLPLHWHVHSLASECSFRMQIPSYDLPTADQSGTATVHQEKNWAGSFPSAHMWLQAREGARGFCCAGGQILGLDAFILGYRSEDYSLDFRPPFAVRFAGFSLFMAYKHDWEDRTFELSIQSFRQKIVVKASAPKGTFFSLSAPFAEGFRENTLAESFQATIKVEVYESGWFSAWKLVREDKFENASLEFGGGYYPPSGSEERFN